MVIAIAGFAEFSALDIAFSFSPGWGAQLVTEVDI
jgi:hypothetical protein